MASSASEAGRAARAAAAALGVALGASLSLPLGAAGAQPARPPAAPAPPTPDALDPEPEAPVGTLRDGTRRVAGRVVAPRDSALVGQPGVWVTLHRVGRDAAGPVDSVQTGPNGAYALRYRPTGAADAVYFVAASRGGVAYFSSPLRQAEVVGEAGEVTVYDTTSRPLPLTVRGRHLIVAAPNGAGVREVLEVYELSNDTTLTAVPPAGSARGVWAAPLPRGATRFAVRESGDVPPDGLALVGGVATLLVPVAPGIKQVAFSYQLPADALPLRVSVDRAAGVFEVLVEEPGANVSGGELAAVAPVALEGKSFRRFLAQQSPAGGEVTVTAGAAGGAAASRWAVPALLAVVGGGMAAALVVAGRRRPRRAVAAPEPLVATADPAPSPEARADVPASRDQLLAELAALDDAFAASEPATAEQRAAYEARRRALKARLAGALAGAAAAD